jgi:hypothetical protein
MECALECQIMIDVLIVLVWIATALFLELNPLTHVSELGSYAPMQKNRVILQVAYDSHVEQNCLLQCLYLLVIAVEHYA